MKPHTPSPALQLAGVPVTLRAIDIVVLVAVVAFLVGRGRSGRR